MNKAELEVLKKEYKDLQNILKELTPEELEFVIGGSFVLKDDAEPTKTKVWFGVDDK